MNRFSLLNRVGYFGLLSRISFTNKRLFSQQLASAPVNTTSTTTTIVDNKLLSKYEKNDLYTYWNMLNEGQDWKSIENTLNDINSALQVSLNYSLIIDIMNALMISVHV